MRERERERKIYIYVLIHIYMKVPKLINFDSEIYSKLQQEENGSRLVNELVRIHYETKEVIQEIEGAQDEIDTYLKRRLSFGHDKNAILINAVDKFKIKSDEVLTRLKVIEGQV